MGEGILGMGVEAGGKDHRLRREGVDLRQDALRERALVVAIPGSGRHGAVERRSAPAYFPVFARGARPRIVGILVGAHVEHGRVGLEGVLGAVAVVHVPVEDEDLVQSVLALQVSSRDRHVVEEAEAQRDVALRVVAGRPAEREAVVDLGARHAVGQRERAARREQRDVVGVRADPDVRHVQVGQAAAAGLPGAIDQLAVVHGLDPGPFAGRSRHRPELVEPRFAAQVVDGALETLSSLGMVRAGVVRQESFVVHESGGHGGAPVTRR